jgi:hypothetical protein
MFIPFDQLPLTARVWIYQAEKALTTVELASVAQVLNQFAAAWDSHGTSLRNSYLLLENRFVVFAVDESLQNASGCSIDKSVNVMKLLSEQLHIDFLDKTQIAYITKENTVATFDFKNIKTIIANHQVEERTIVFNNLVSNVADFQTNWKVEMANTWLGKYFK